VAISALYPKVSLSALFGLQHAYLPIAHYLSTENLWDVGVSVSMPILEFGNIEGQINAADARQAQSYHQYRQTVLTALGDVETDLSNLTQETRRDAMLREADKSANYAVKVAHNRLPQRPGRFYRRAFRRSSNILASRLIRLLRNPC